MSKLTWDDLGKRLFETGVDRGVLYIPDGTGAFTTGVAWNGLTAVTESPTGAGSTPEYADNLKYLNLIAAEDFGATVEAYTYPDEFGQFDGLVTPTPGVNVGQQDRKTFGLCYRTKLGNDVSGDSFGYKLHLLYGCQAAPSDRAYSTVNDKPASIVFKWVLSTTGQAVTGRKPTSLITIDSTKVTAPTLTALETILYGGVGVNPVLPTPDSVIATMTSGVTNIAVLTAPTYVTATHTITIPAQAGIGYYIGGVLQVAGPVVLTAAQSVIVSARANTGYTIASGNDTDWQFTY